MQFQNGVATVNDANARPGRIQARVHPSQVFEFSKEGRHLASIYFEGSRLYVKNVRGEADSFIQAKPNAAMMGETYSSIQEMFNATLLSGKPTIGRWVTIITKTLGPIRMQVSSIPSKGTFITGLGEDNPPVTVTSAEFVSAKADAAMAEIKDQGTVYVGHGQTGRLYTTGGRSFTAHETRPNSSYAGTPTTVVREVRLGTNQMVGANVTSVRGPASSKTVASGISKIGGDKAALANPVKGWNSGGIDLNTTNGMQWKVSKDGSGVEMNIDPAMIERIRA